jgi:hypothetical protein
MRTRLYDIVRPPQPQPGLDWDEQEEGGAAAAAAAGSDDDFPQQLEVPGAGPIGRSGSPAGGAAAAAAGAEGGDFPDDDELMEMQLDAQWVSVARSDCMLVRPRNGGGVGVVGSQLVSTGLMQRCTCHVYTSCATPSMSTLDGASTSIKHTGRGGWHMAAVHAKVTTTRHQPPAVMTPRHGCLLQDAADEAFQDDWEPPAAPPAAPAASMGPPPSSAAPTAAATTRMSGAPPAAAPAAAAPVVAAGDSGGAITASARRKRTLGECSSRR